MKIVLSFPTGGYAIFLDRLRDAAAAEEQLNEARDDYDNLDAYAEEEEVYAQACVDAVHALWAGLPGDIVIEIERNRREET